MSDLHETPFEPSAAQRIRGAMMDQANVLDRAAAAMGEPDATSAHVAAKGLRWTAINIEDDQLLSYFGALKAAVEARQEGTA